MSRGPTTHSLDELAEDMKELTRSVRDFGNDLVWIKRIGAFIAAMLVAAIVGSGRLIWDASALNSDVKQQGKAMEELRSDLKQQGSRLEKVERRLDGIDQKLDTLISRTVPRTGG